MVVQCNKGKPNGCQKCLVSPKQRIFKENHTKPTVVSDKGLKILKIDKLIAENGVAHHTSKFELMNRDDDSTLVVRRGQEFYLTLRLNRDYDPKLDGISVVFKQKGASKLKTSLGNYIVAPLLRDEKQTNESWLNYVVMLAGTGVNRIMLKISTPADALIGQWNVSIDTKMDNSTESHSFKLDGGIIILFNPWCPEDAVFLADEDARQEYVMADTGLIWRGSHNEMHPTIWRYAQFEKDILECTLYLMNEVGQLRGTARRDPVMISRVLSAAVNANDDNGVLVGNWSGKYASGITPTRWLGSQKILQWYYSTKKPVKFGQCWVFAGVLATICRALGLPCRVVTNFESAHDTEGSLTVDRYFDDKGKELKHYNRDSIWNFHVWNEVWMKRSDIGEEFDGWQVIDATPQESSGGIYRCGPASLNAIKSGKLLAPYDASFIFAEVNADKVFWKYNGDSQPLKLIRTDPVCIGKGISTKAVGCWAREDITHLYKYPEKSQEERNAVHRALRESQNMISRYYLNDVFDDITFNFKLCNEIIIGQPFSVVLEMTNSNKELAHEVSVVLRADVISYTGCAQDASPIKSITFEKLLKPGTKVAPCLDISWDGYGHKLLDQCTFNITCLAKVKDTEYEYVTQEVFKPKKPTIEIELTSKAQVGELLVAKASFINPLPIALTNARFLIEGSGLAKQLKIKLLNDVQPGQQALCEFSMTPKRAEEAAIGVTFYSNELDDVHGYINFTVKSAEPRIIRCDAPPTMVVQLQKSIRKYNQNE